MTTNISSSDQDNISILNIIRSKFSFKIIYRFLNLKDIILIFMSMKINNTDVTYKLQARYIS